MINGAKVSSDFTCAHGIPAGQRAAPGASTAGDVLDVPVDDALGIRATVDHIA
jgi:hypothetical protein